MTSRMTSWMLLLITCLPSTTGQTPDVAGSSTPPLPESTATRISTSVIANTPSASQISISAIPSTYAARISTYVIPDNFSYPLQTEATTLTPHHTTVNLTTQTASVFDTPSSAMPLSGATTSNTIYTNIVESESQISTAVQSESVLKTSASVRLSYSEADVFDSSLISSYKESKSLIETTSTPSTVIPSVFNISEEEPSFSPKSVLSPTSTSITESSMAVFLSSTYTYKNTIATQTESSSQSIISGLIESSEQSSMYSHIRTYTSQSSLDSITSSILNSEHLHTIVSVKTSPISSLESLPESTPSIQITLASSFSSSVTTSYVSLDHIVSSGTVHPSFTSISVISVPLESTLTLTHTGETAMTTPVIISQITSSGDLSIVNLQTKSASLDIGASNVVHVQSTPSHSGLSTSLPDISFTRSSFSVTATNQVSRHSAILTNSLPLSILPSHTNAVMTSETSYAMTYFLNQTTTGREVSSYASYLPNTLITVTTSVSSSIRPTKSIVIFKSVTSSLLSYSYVESEYLSKSKLTIESISDVRPSGTYSFDIVHTVTTLHAIDHSTVVHLSDIPHSVSVFSTITPSTDHSISIRPSLTSLRQFSKGSTSVNSESISSIRPYFSSDLPSSVSFSATNSILTARVNSISTTSNVGLTYSPEASPIEPSTSTLLVTSSSKMLNSNAILISSTDSDIGKSVIITRESFITDTITEQSLTTKHVVYLRSSSESLSPATISPTNVLAKSSLTTSMLLLSSYSNLEMSDNRSTDVIGNSVSFLSTEQTSSNVSPLYFSSDSINVHSVDISSSSLTIRVLRPSFIMDLSFSSSMHVQEVQTSNYLLSPLHRTDSRLTSSLQLHIPSSFPISVTEASDATVLTPVFSSTVTLNEHESKYSTVLTIISQRSSTLSIIDKMSNSISGNAFTSPVSAFEDILTPASASVPLSTTLITNILSRTTSALFDSEPISSRYSTFAEFSSSHGSLPVPTSTVSLQETIVRSPTSTRLNIPTSVVALSTDIVDTRFLVSSSSIHVLTPISAALSSQDGSSALPFTGYTVNSASFHDISPPTSTVLMSPETLSTSFTVIPSSYSSTSQASLTPSLPLRASSSPLSSFITSQPMYMLSRTATRIMSESFSERYSNLSWINIISESLSVVTSTSTSHVVVSRNTITPVSVSISKSTTVVEETSSKTDSQILESYPISSHSVLSGFSSSRVPTISLPLINDRSSTLVNINSSTTVFSLSKDITGTSVLISNSSILDITLSSTAPTSIVSSPSLTFTIYSVNSEIVNGKESLTSTIQMLPQTFSKSFTLTSSNFSSTPHFSVTTSLPIRAPSLSVSTVFTSPPLHVTSTSTTINVSMTRSHTLSQISYESYPSSVMPSFSLTEGQSQYKTFKTSTSQSGDGILSFTMDQTTTETFKLTTAILSTTSSFKFSSDSLKYLMVKSSTNTLDTTLRETIVPSTSISDNNLNTMTLHDNNSPTSSYGVSTTRPQSKSYQVSTSDFISTPNLTMASSKTLITRLISSVSIFTPTGIVSSLTPQSLYSGDSTSSVHLTSTGKLVSSARDTPSPSIPISMYSDTALPTSHLSASFLQSSVYTESVSLLKPASPTSTPFIMPVSESKGVLPTARTSDSANSIASSYSQISLVQTSTSPFKSSAQSPASSISFDHSSDTFSYSFISSRTTTSLVSISLATYSEPASFSSIDFPSTPLISTSKAEVKKSTGPTVSSAFQTAFVTQRLSSMAPSFATHLETVSASSSRPISTLMSEPVMTKSISLSDYSLSPSASISLSNGISSMSHLLSTHSMNLADSISTIPSMPISLESKLQITKSPTASFSSIRPTASDTVSREKSSFSEFDSSSSLDITHPTTTANSKFEFTSSQTSSSDSLTTSSVVYVMSSRVSHDLSRGLTSSFSSPTSFISYSSSSYATKQISVESLSTISLDIELTTTAIVSEPITASLERSMATHSTTFSTFTRTSETQTTTLSPAQSTLTGPSSRSSLSTNMSLPTSAVNSETNLKSTSFEYANVSSPSTFQTTNSLGFASSISMSGFTDIAFTSISSSTSFLVSTTSVISPTSVVPATSVVPTTTSIPTTTSVPTTTSAPPTTASPEGTTLNATTAEEPYWVKTVLKIRQSTDVTTQTFLADLERRLALAYNEAFLRQRLVQQGRFEPLRRRRRKKRFTTVGDASIHVRDVTRTAGTSSVSAIYVVSRDGRVLTATEAVAALGLLDQQEAAILLGHVLETQATPYLPVEPTPTDDESSKLWLIAAIGGPVVAFLIFIWILLCVYFKCPPRSRRHGKQTWEPEMTSIQQTPQKITDLSSVSEAPARQHRPQQHPVSPTKTSGHGHGSKVRAYEISVTPEPDIIPTSAKAAHSGVLLADTPLRSPSRSLAPPKPKRTKKARRNSVEPMPIDVSAESDRNTSPHPGPSFHDDKSQLLQSSISDDNEELQQRARLERRRNKDRLREKRRRERGEDRKVADFVTSQNQLNALGMHSTSVPNVHVQSGSPVKKPALSRHDSGVYNGQLSADENLEEARSRMHTLLDEAFSLITPRASMTEHDVRHKHEAEMTSSTRDKPEEPNTERRRSSRWSIPTDNGRDTEVKHEPMFVNPAYSSSYSDFPLETWSPYRAYDQVALISMPQKLDPEPTRLGHKSEVIETHPPKSTKRPAASFDINESKSVSAIDDTKYTTSPPKPIVLKTKDLPSTQADTAKGSSSKWAQQRKFSMAGLNGDQTKLNGSSTATPGQTSRNNTDKMELKSYPNGSERRHRAPSKDLRNNDEVDIINNLKPTEKSDDLLKSLRDELSVLKENYKDPKSGKRRKSQPRSMTEIV